MPVSERDWIAMEPPIPGMRLSRREWLKASAAAGALLPTLPLLAAGRGEARSYHLCLNPAAVEQDPERLRMIRDVPARSGHRRKRDRPAPPPCAGLPPMLSG